MKQPATVRDFHSFSGDTVLCESKPALPAISRSDLVKMASRRRQSPDLEPMGRYWTIRIRREAVINGEIRRVQVREKIAPLDTPIRKAQKMRDAFLLGLNSTPPTLGAATTLKAFVEGVYEKITLPLMPKSHRERYESVLKVHLLPALGSCTLFDLEQQASTLVEEFLIGLKPKNLSRESLKKIRSCGSSVFKVAMKKGYAGRNPFQGAEIPQGRPTPKQKPTLTVQQFEKLVQIISEPYATMVYVAIYTGLRASEVIGLRWNDLQEWAITIDEKYCRGEWGEPKTECSRATIAVLKKVISRIYRLKGMKIQIGGGRAGYQTFNAVKSENPGDLIFRGVRSGREMRDNNILTRHIKPAARQLGLGFVNWQCLRRSHATWLKRAGVPLKDASFQMRHSRTSTTAEIYQMTPVEDQVLALEKLEALTQRVN